MLQCCNSPMGFSTEVLLLFQSSGFFFLSLNPNLWPLYLKISDEPHLLKMANQGLPRLPCTCDTTPLTSRALVLPTCSLPLSAAGPCPQYGHSQSCRDILQHLAKEVTSPVEHHKAEFGAFDVILKFKCLCCS